MLLVKVVGEVTLTLFELVLPSYPGASVRIHAILTFERFLADLLVVEYIHYTEERSYIVLVVAVI
jgi:hypothetical protein